MSDNAKRTETPPAEDRLSSLWRRISDHKMVQWTVAYVAVAYGIQHGITLTSEAFEWPHAVERVTMLLLALGLPVVMTLAWYHGARASRRISGPELSIISILLVIGAFLFYVFARPVETIAAGPSSATQQANIVSGPGTRGGISIAVLPFANMSGDASQEFFSDGMTEEITAALAKVPNLRVVGRTSAFQFKGENKDMRAIGQALSATHLIEGSVRKDGSQLRITAQLVKVDDGTHVWTESYDRELKGIFAVQEEIAQAIAASLQVPLGLKQGETLVSNRTNDLESYQQYLRARALFRGREVTDAISVLELVVARDPNYAPAWSLLAESYTFATSYGVGGIYGKPFGERRQVVRSFDDKAEAAARNAIRLDPKHAEGYAALAYVRGTRAKWAESDDLFRQALALDSNDTDVLHLQSITAINAGRLKEGLATRKTLQTLEPFVPAYNMVTALAMQLVGANDASIRLLQGIPNEGAVGAQRTAYLALAEAVAGQYAKAADTILMVPPNQTYLPKDSVENAARLLRTAPAKTSAPEQLPELESLSSFVYPFIGAPDRLLDSAERAVDRDHISANEFRLLWHPAFRSIRRTERFKALMRKAGLVDYWRARGWPDLCHPVGADDFVCE